MAQAIRTLGDAARHHMLVKADCTCGNVRFFRAFDLISLFGAGRDPLSLRFQCRACQPKTRVTMMEIDHDRRPKIVVHVPMIEGGRVVAWYQERLR